MKSQANANEKPAPAAAYSGPFAAPSPLPLHYPQFDKIADSDYAPLAPMTNLGTLSSN